MGKAVRKTETLSRDEATAVLLELEFQAEERLVEACSAFEDIALEMEWRLREWLGLCAERELLERQVREGMIRAKFNLLARNTVRIEEMHDSILSRNEEGNFLLGEIFLLDKKLTRLGRSLSRLNRPPLCLVREKDAAEALARLSLRLEAQPDLPDVATLIAAAQSFSRKLAEAEGRG
jgi:hypothetical protein